MKIPNRKSLPSTTAGIALLAAGIAFAALPLSAQTSGAGAASSRDPAYQSGPGSVNADGSRRNVGLDGKSTVKRTDRRFVEKAAEHGTHEVAVARIGAERATDPQVRSFAQRLVADHEKANTELMRLASTKAIVLTADKKMKDHTPSWADKRGKDFDEEFLEWAVDSHEDAIDLFEKEVKSGADAELMAFANKTLPTLREHLRVAKEYAKLVD